MTSSEHEHANEHLTGTEHVLEGRDDAYRGIAEAEARLWSSAAEQDGDRLEWLLHHDFTGVTREGVCVSRADLIDARPQTISHGERDFSRWHFHSLPWPLVLATYTLADSSGSSRHMSIWDISTGLARLRFHQGTWESVLEAA